MGRRLSYCCESVEPQDGNELLVTGECWFGPICVGDEFAELVRDERDMLPARLVVGSIVCDGKSCATLPPRTAGALYLSGPGVSLVRAGDTLVGNGTDGLDEASPDRPSLARHQNQRRGLGCAGWFGMVLGLLVLFVTVGIPAYQRWGLGAAIREQRSREDVVVAALERLTMPGLTAPGAPSRLSDDELRQGYAISRTPWLEIFMCGDVCTGWTPGAVVTSDYVLVDMTRRTPDQVCRAMLQRFATPTDPARLAVSERGPITPDGCGLIGATPDGIDLDIAVRGDRYTASRPVYVSIGGSRD